MVALSLALGISTSFIAFAGDASTWPGRKTIEIVLGAKAGGDTDAQIRRFAKYLEKELGASIAIVNMPGSSATIAGQYVHDADPDGYTMMALNPESFAPYYFGITEYNSSDYAIAGIGAIDDTLIFCTRKESPYPTLKSLVEAAKANPGKIELPAMQPGGYSYMSALLFQAALGVEFNLTDIASNGEKIVQLLAGKVDVIGNQYWFVQDYVEKGDFIVYCVMADERNPAFPDIPTLKELGYDIGITSVPKYFYFAFPKGTDKAIVDKFSAALKAVVESPEYVADATKAMTTPFYLNADDATAYIADQEVNVYKKLAKMMGF
jgi:tripartite-type tricarboxylate transporter receptor subunit TctC